MRISRVFLFSCCAPLALMAYDKAPDSGLVFTETSYKLVDPLDGKIHQGVKAALLVAPDDRPEIRHYSNSSMAQVEVLTLAADGRVKAHRLDDNGVEQVFIVLEGQLEFVAGGEKLPVEANDIVFIPAGLERSFAVTGGQPARIVRAEWREKGAAAAKGARAMVVSEKLRPLAPTGGEGYLTISPNPRQQVNPVSIIGYGASHINASNSLLLYSADISGARPFTANTRFARMGLSQYHPGGGTRWHFHPDREQCFVILSGKGLVEIGANTIEVKRGDVLFAPRHVGHGYRTAGAEPLKFLELEWGRN